MDSQVHYLAQHKDQEEYSCWLRTFINVYQQLSIDNLDLLDEVYHQDIHFIDPIHEVLGFNNLVSYFDNLYANLLSCDFCIDEVIQSEDSAAIYWQMTYSHPKLNSGDKVTVSGHSHLKCKDNKIIYHRDYLDVGAMLYEHIPFVGKVVKAIKYRAIK